MTRSYPPDRYDRNLLLKVPLPLILVLMYVARHFLIIFLAFNPLPKLAGVFAFMQPLVSTPAIFLTDIPGFLVLVAWAKRKPGAGYLWRWIWNHGRELLTAALLAHFLILATTKGWDALSAFNYLHAARLVIVNLAVDLLLVYFLWRFPLVGDVFRDFPEDEDTPSP
jgi:hypothetical protein